MKHIEVLWFDDVSALNEPVLSFPVIGRISMRQFFILGVAAMVSYGLFSSYQTIFSIIPAGFGAFLALTKPKVTSSEQMLLSTILFFMGKRSSTKTGAAKKPTKKNKISTSSKKLGFADALVDDTQEPEMRTIVVSDLAKPYRFKVKVVDRAGKILKAQKSKIYINGTYQDTLTTDINGELETIIIPQAIGLKKITISVDDQKEPVFSETIKIQANLENLA
ncbi:MAG: hypothetical protein KGH87_02390 [Thaumarchaeota archaeon]|nr:hypothetical protein [Nitrososphaerota archaeon]